MKHDDNIENTYSGAAAVMSNQMSSIESKCYYFISKSVSAAGLINYYNSNELVLVCFVSL